ncbi:INO80 complex subunit D-like [Vigna radiata var. radiata]|uniref:INO80 complex subunit D-like n=1 Tax=Vigna radiata var. radiata TaxID=3916 RepID=A0A1S3UKY1_VIGRR|nr:INO80 complex subunit D-like [Vigna radiata var. radiata]
MDESASASSPLRPVTVDGADADAALSKSRFLTREEVLRRRLRRVKQLGRCYRAHYWALMEELRSKYRDYSWTYGKSPFKEGHNETDIDYQNGGGVPALGGGDDIVRCRFSGCKTKAMALTTYCHSHILSDSKQRLYHGCRAVAKNLPTGPSFCNKPVLKTMVPPACPTHHQFGERCLARALRRAGLGNAIPSNRKPTVKLHVLVSEFVHQIQNKRKLALKETAPKVETE